MVFITLLLSHWCTEYELVKNFTLAPVEITVKGGRQAPDSRAHLIIVDICAHPVCTNLEDLLPILSYYFPPSTLGVFTLYGDEP